MATEQRKQQIKDSILYYFDQYDHWHELYMRDDHASGDDEEPCRQKSEQFRQMYQNMLAEFFDFDMMKAYNYSAPPSRGGVMRFLEEN